MDNADYHADFSAVSCSMLKVFLESRREYQARYITRTKPPSPPSDSMNLGSLAHAMLLEPTAMERFVVIPPDVLSANGAKTGGKWKAFCEEHDGKTLLTQKEFDVAQRMIDAVIVKCGAWFAGPGKPECDIRWTDKASGVPCKARVDYLLPSFIFDFKTAKNATPRAFRYAVREYKYWLQDVHYADGVRTLTGIEPRFLFVVVQSEAPYQCRVYETPEFENVPDYRRIDKAYARGVREDALKALAKCYETHDWSDTGEDTIYTLYSEDCQ